MQHQPPAPPVPPGPSTPALAARPTNTMAVISLVLGIGSFVFLPLLGAIGAVITGHLARGEIRRTGEAGAELALIGLILGYVHLVLAALALLIVGIIVLVTGGFILSQIGH